MHPLLLLAGCSQKTEAPAAATAPKGVGSIERLDPALDSIIPANAIIEKIGGGFSFTEGPLWRPDGHLWFSDVTANLVRSITPNGEVKVLIEKAGGETTAPPGSFVGPNGMVADKDGNVLLCQHTNRQIVRVDEILKQTVFIDRFEGKRLNSPNDSTSPRFAVFHRPPYGLLKQDEDPAKEIKFNGVYRYANGKVTVLVKDLTRPNGIAFSPDEKVLYVANSDEKKRIWMRYDVKPMAPSRTGRCSLMSRRNPRRASRTA